MYTDLQNILSEKQNYRWIEDPFISINNGITQSVNSAFFDVIIDTHPNSNFTWVTFQGLAHTVPQNSTSGVLVCKFLLPGKQQNKIMKPQDFIVRHQITLVMYLGSHNFCHCSFITLTHISLILSQKFSWSSVTVKWGFIFLNTSSNLCQVTVSDKSKKE